MYIYFKRSRKKKWESLLHNEVKNKPEKLDLNIDKWLGLNVIIHKKNNNFEKINEIINNNNENNKNTGNTYNIFIQDSFNDNSDNSIQNSFNDNRKYNYKTEKKDNSWKFSISLWPF